MGFVSDFVGGFTGSAGKKAARAGAAAQVEAVGKAKANINLATEKAVGELRPFADMGKDTLDDLFSLVTDPEAQKNFITDNPFFDTLTEKAERDILSNQAAAGKVGSGDTAEALQESFLLLGADLLNQNITQRGNLVTGIGLPASSNIAGIEERKGVNFANLAVGAGDALAAGEIGAAAAVTQGAQNIVNTAMAIGTGGFSGGSFSNPTAAGLPGHAALGRKPSINL